MSSVFESIKQGLNEAIEFERGNLPNVKVDKVVVSPLHTYTSSEIRAIRVQQNMTQKIFAEALGVSVKTIEAWESGINHPSGIARRMLELLSLDDSLLERYSVVARS
ncbi:MAG: helix-turn-helix domain-containing protein [Oscillospiraceae bacterium]|nr:helix-turn-helix domain-containing protein [Oscillospiraceae bacterium]